MSTYPNLAQNRVFQCSFEEKGQIYCRSFYFEFKTEKRPPAANVTIH